MSILAVALIFAIALAGGWVSRMAGGGPPKLPFGLDQHIYALPYALVVAHIAGFWSVLAYAGAFLGKRTGHGRGMSLKLPMKPGSKPERLEYLILWLKPFLPVYWYKILILAVTGLAVTIVPGVLLAVFSAPGPGLILAFSGLSKAPAYMIGWFIYPKGHSSGNIHLKEATAIGEFLTGFFGWGVLALVTAYTGGAFNG